MYEYGSPDNRRIENRQKKNRKVWSSPEWKKAKAKFLRENPTCCRCSTDSQVPHHPNLEVYGRPEYLDLSDTRPYCNQCHRGEHSGKFQCPVCRKIVARSEGERCFTCLEDSDKQRIKSSKSERNEAKNKYQRKQYRKYHPKKVVVDGVWTTISRNGNTSTS